MTRRPYRPSNGTEGEAFMSVWCARCERDREHREGHGDGCDIIAMTMAFNVNDPDYPKEWVVDADHGNALCTAFTTDPAAPDPLDPTAVIRPLL